MQRGLRRHAARRAVLALGGIALAGCLPLPVHTASSVRGRVVDAATGRPLAGAVVVVRFDARHGDVLPDRELLGHVEVLTDSEGRFESGIFVRPGFTILPLVRTEARLAGAMFPGYRCPRPVVLEASEPALIALQRATGLGDRRASCRPLAAPPREIPRYLAAWRDLYPSPRASALERSEEDERVERMLEARRRLGFGSNCEGPVLDLALAPDGTRFAYLVRAEGRTQVVVDGFERSRKPERIEVRSVAAPETRRLVWTERGELVLWEAVGVLDPSVPTSTLAVAEHPLEVVWREAAPPAASAGAPAQAGQASPKGRLLELGDLHDEGDARRAGRSFALTHTLDPVSGLPVDWLNVRWPNGNARVYELPGEVCDSRGLFGHPQDRIAADGRTALDLRFVDGGCHPVGIDLDSGRSLRLDAAAAPALCESTLRIPPAQLAAALGGYAGEVEAALERAGADRSAPYTLRIEAEGRAEVTSFDPQGGSVRAPLPPFPLETPLRRIEVSALSLAIPGSRIIPGIEPL